MEDMPRPRPPHLHRQITRHGKATWYVRIGKGPRTRIRADYGTPEFDIDYQAAISSTPRPTKNAPVIGTLKWLIDRYRESTAWTTLSLATRRQRENIFLHVLETAGEKKFIDSKALQSMPGWNVAHQHRLNISSMQCAVCSNGRCAIITFQSIPPPTLNVHK